MKKIIVVLSVFLLISCSDETVVNECFNDLNVSGIVNLTNPEFIELQVPGGFATTSIDGRNILLINTATSGFKAFDLACPEGSCGSIMTFDGLKLACPCTNKEYSSLNGSPINGEGCFALEYNVLEGNNGTLQISI